MKCSNCDTEYEQEYCPVCDIRYLEEIPPWYYKNWFIAICLVAVLPVGLVLVWRKPGWTFGLTCMLTAGFGLFCIALAASVNQSFVGVNKLYLNLEGGNSVSYDTGLTIETSVEGTPEKAWLFGLVYYSDDESVARFENGKVLTVGEGKTEIYVSNREKTVFSNKIVLEVVDKEAAWIQLEANRSRQAEEIEQYISVLVEITPDSGDAIEQARKAYDSAETEVQQMVANLDVLLAAEREYKQLMETQDMHEDDLYLTVYYTQTGSKYHYANPCGSGTYYPCTLEEALEKGLEPCRKCVK